ncbi:MAG: 16S rRNA (uracil(1498)-N(3))-methyltransferase [Magnetococcales bacterium]|nr:16S rRNA (uracil(1498)-N(3))-methyltransferase [Magnetococcales bacterium]
MATPRLFVDGPLTGSSHRLPQESAHYLTRVLRLRPGAEVTLFDGRGGEWLCRLLTADKHVDVESVEWRPGVPEPLFPVVLVQGLAKAQAMEWVVQKGVELGMTALLPLVTSRSVPRPRGDHEGNLRWERIAREAAEQCGRTVVPRIHPPVGWEALAGLLPPGKRWLFWEEARNAAGWSGWGGPLAEEGVSLLVGPEGGLSASEVVQAQALGFEKVGLGPRILRTETAALAALAALQSRWGERTPAG